MLEINLLPEEFRIQVKEAAPEIPALKIAVGVAVLFSILTLWFYFDYVGSQAKLKKLDAEWKVVQPQALELSNLKSELEGVIKPERDFLKSFVTTERPLKLILQWISEYLPEGAWLTGLSLRHESAKRSLVIQGLCLSSKDVSSIEAIELFLHNLKEQMPETKLSLTTSRQIFEGVELTQFTSVFQWEMKGAGK